MDIEITRNQNKVVVRVAGRLDTLASAQFNSQMEPFLSEQAIDLTLDFEGLEYIASSGLRTLLSLYKALEENESALHLVNVQPVVMQVFKMSRFTDFLKIE